MLRVVAHSRFVTFTAGVRVQVAGSRAVHATSCRAEIAIHNMKINGAALRQNFSIQEKQFCIEKIVSSPLIFNRKIYVLYKT
jgi:hypothetical protein